MKKIAVSVFGALSALVLFTGCCNTCSPGGCSSCGTPTYGAPMAAPTYESASPAYTTPPVYSSTPPGSGTIVTPPVVSGP